MKLQRVIDQYIDYRQALGAGFQGNALRAFGRAMGTSAHIEHVRTEQVETFLAGTGPITRTWHIKLGALRPFFEYAVGRGYLAAAPLPVCNPKRPPAFVPYIYSHEELRRLLQAADFDQRRQKNLEPVTVRTILLLLYGAGLRLQEALRLNRGDVDLDNTLLTVCQTKFGKTRLVPFSPQLGSCLSQYAALTARAGASQTDAPFFTSRRGTRIATRTLQHNFRHLCQSVGICRTDHPRFQPRLHDLRHTFAVHRLTSWYQNGVDAQRLLPLLSVYLGHVCLRHTQVYLTLTPELLHQAGQRFELYAETENCHD